ncbi:MAG: hypothetical protein CL916_08100 [Deltaproteobacteria bacterium]|nr:hypothetical protein [Deltaproteobacteria bacterium]
MPLIKCPECSTQVSDQAPACPSCGFPINTALVEQNSQAVAPQAAPMHNMNAQDIGQAVAEANNEFAQRKSSGGAIGALIGAALGYFLMASACETDFQTLSLIEFTMQVFFWSPVILIGMIMGYFFGKAVG